MSKFAVGDRVERIGVLVPEYMRYGTIVCITPNKVGEDVFNEYEVVFGNHMTGTFYEPQLRLVKNSP